MAGIARTGEDVLAALIQVAAAYHHFQRGNPEGTTLLLRAALHRLELYPDSFAGVPVILLSEGIREWLDAVNSERTPGPVFPLIRLGMTRQLGNLRSIS